MEGIRGVFIEEGMKSLIIRSKKHGVHAILYDDEYHDLISGYRWNIYTSPRHSTYYAHTRIKTKNGHTTLRFHRLILGVTCSKIQVDHKNGNGLDNTFANLRVCNASQNGGNQRKSKCNTSGFKGVHQNKINGRWIAKLGHENKKIVLGTFHSIKDAVIAYNHAALKFKGEFAKLNPIP